MQAPDNAGTLIPAVEAEQTTQQQSHAAAVAFGTGMMV
jgi:hypothetical protein